MEKVVYFLGFVSGLIGWFGGLRAAGLRFGAYDLSVEGFVGSEEPWHTSTA